MKKTVKKDSSAFVIGIVIIAFLINFIGKFVASYFNWPVWLDSIGTCLIAYLYGPVCGAIIGAGINISYGLFDKISFMYVISGMVIGIICGIMARRGFFYDFFKISVMAGVLAIASLVTSLPVNIRYNNGYTSNLWGDGVYDLFREKGYNAFLSALLAEFSIDFVDKWVVILCTLLLIKLIKSKKVSKRFVSTTLAICILVLPLATYSITSYAEDAGETEIDGDFYTMTTYNDRNGLPGGEANDIEFTNDGYVWVGTYSGLYQYDGIDFEIREADKIKSVNYLYGDEEGRVWIGTNDSGLAVMVDNKITNIISEENGLASNSVSCICSDIYGYYYVGTKKGLNIVTMDAGIRVIDSFPEIDYARSIVSGSDGYTVIITNSGNAHVMKDAKYLFSFTSFYDNAGFTQAFFKGNELWVGTFSNKILRFRLNDQAATYVGQISIGDLNNVRKIVADEAGKAFVCADNGIGHISNNNEFHPINTGAFCAAIDDVGFDYQGNIWFVSTRHGLLKLNESAFFNIYGYSKYESDVVNAIIKWNGNYYLGSDDGLDVLKADFSIDSNNRLSKELDGQRIRNLFVDSKNHLWISITSGKGLIEVDPDYKMTIYNDKNGMLCNRFRSVIELRDNTIAVAGDSGIDFIKDGKIMSSISKDEGLTTTMVLTMYESSDGSIYAGTDGSGIAIIRDNKIVDYIDSNDGLSSNVILRIIDDKEGLFIVTSNGLNFIDKSNSVKYLSTFPYSNNFDMYEDVNGNIWVLSSAGIFLVNREELLLNEEITYSLLDYKYGLYGSITANSWSLMTDDGILHVPCDNGCYIVDTNEYLLNSVPYRMIVDYAMEDEKLVEVSDDRSIRVSGDSKDTVFHLMVPNYTSNELYVGYMLVGYDEKERVIPAGEIGDIKYTNLKSGDYKFILNLYGENKRSILERVSYDFEKEMRIFDHTWFRIYVIIVYGLFVAWVTWLLANRAVAKEREKRTKLEHDAKMTNETIMAIAKTVDAKDEKTSKHSERVAMYSVSIASALGWSKQECEDIYKTGLLHDIGKIGIPDAVLNKPGKLTDEEYALMKTHVDKGAEILRGFTIVKDVDLGTRFHHERYDGKGYPKGLKGNDIPIQARIIGLVDAFDAMTSNRVYRQKLPLSSVLEEIKRCSGTQFDPYLVEVFLKLIDDKDIDVEVLYEDE